MSHSPARNHKPSCQRLFYEIYTGMFKNPNVQNVILLARDAGDILMSYRGKVDPEYKGDDSPVTQADKDSSDLIIQGLKKLTPDIPVVSEEQDMDLNRAIVSEHDTYWVTDPLDGTKSYIDGYDGFGVHIALIHKGEPVMGVAYFPAQEDGAGKLYYTGNNGKAYVKAGKTSPRVMKVSENAPRIRAAMGWKDKPAMQYSEIVRAVGGARLCVTAEGQANIAQFHSYFSYWDVAAGHAILKAAGGGFYTAKTMQDVRYDDPSLVTPPAFGGHLKLVQNLRPLPPVHTPKP